MLGSIGVIGGAIAIRFTGLTWIDPVVAVGIGLWVLPRTWILLRDTANVLLEGVPRGMSLNDVRAAIVGVPGVQNAHDLHVWSITSGNISCSVHIIRSEEHTSELQSLMRISYAVFCLKKKKNKRKNQQK